jgi:hypothetical protein
MPASSSVRTPGERNAPSIPCRAPASDGRHPRDGGWATNSATPTTVQAALSTSAAAGETSAMTAAEISGPVVNSSSIATESTANAAGSNSRRRRSRSGHSVRSAAPMFGIARPPTSAHATSAAVGAPASVSASSAPVANASITASGSITRP